MKKTVLVLIMLILIAKPCFSDNTTRRFIKGEVNITVHYPTETRLAVCTPNEKYSMEPGTSQLIRLYVRNDLKDKTIYDVELDILTDADFIWQKFPEVIDVIPADEYRYFDLNVTIPEDTRFGDYRVDFLIGTDEYMMGAFQDVILIRIRSYSDELYLFLGGIIILVLIAWAVRFVWIIQINRKATQKRHKSHTRKRSISEYYYKSKKDPKKPAK